MFIAPAAPAALPTLRGNLSISIPFTIQATADDLKRIAAEKGFDDCDNPIESAFQSWIDDEVWESLSDVFSFDPSITVDGVEIEFDNVDAQLNIGACLAISEVGIWEESLSK